MERGERDTEEERWNGRQGFKQAPTADATLLIEATSLNNVVNKKYIIKPE